MFARIAPRYDLMNRIMSLGMDLRWRRVAVRKAGLPAGSTVLDLGAGSGDVSRILLEHDPGYYVVSFDICPELIAYGRHKFEAVSECSRWMAGDGRFLPFSAECFNGVFAAFSLRNMADLSQVFDEIKRVLRRGGKIVILDMTQPDHWFYKKIFNFHFKYIVPRLGKWLASDPEAYLYLMPSIKNFYKANELKEKLSELGFSKIQIKKIMFQIVTLCIGTKN